MSGQPLVIVDRAATVASPSDAEVHSWAADQRVFISSVLHGMRQHRETAAEVVRRVGAEPVWFEAFGGRDDGAEQAYLSEVASCDIYVGLLGERYGRLLAPRRYSATHLEYQEAERRGLRLSVWVDRTVEPEGRQQDFIEEVRAFVTTGEYADAAGLGQAVEGRLRRIAAEELMPWCKLGPAVFRARRIRDDGRALDVHAVVKDPSVLRELEQMRPGGWGQSFHGLFSRAGRCTAVGVTKVEATMTSTRQHTVHVALRADDEQPSRPSVRTAAINFGLGTTYTPDDLAELGLCAGLFGDDIPGPIRWATHPVDPLQPLRDLSISEDAVAGLALVLVTEALVGSGRAVTVDRVRIGRVIDGTRRVVVTWIGHDGKQRTVDGMATWPPWNSMAAAAGARTEA